MGVDNYSWASIDDLCISNIYILERLVYEEIPHFIV